MSRSGGKPAGAVVLLLAAAMGLASCGFGEPEIATSPSGTPVRKPAAANSDMVAAVSSGNSEQALVNMRFALAKHPKVGEPVDIEVSLTPTVPLERLFVRFQAAEGLQIVSGGQTEQLENAPGGVAIGHKVTVLPKADGIFYVTAVVLADSVKDSISRTFTIPLIAGEGLSAAPVAPPAANVSDPRREAARP